VGGFRSGHSHLRVGCAVRAAEFATQVVADEVMMIHVQAESFSIEPETVVASISAFESEGIVISIEPLTELNLTDERKGVKRSLQMAIDSGEIGAAGKIVSFQSAVDARRMYLTLRARNIRAPLMSLISSRRAPRGTVRVYSTVAGLLCQPQLK